MSRQYELVSGGSVLGVVTVDPNESDFPWLVGRLEPSPAYAAVQQLFDAIDRALDEDGFTEGSGSLEAQVMAPGVWMRSVDSGEATEVTGFTIEGNRVSWR